MTRKGSSTRSVRRAQAMKMGNLHNDLQRYPERKAHGSAADDVAGTETESDMNAMLYYHRVGTIQGTVPL